MSSFLLLNYSHPENGISGKKERMALFEGTVPTYETLFEGIVPTYKALFKDYCRTPSYVYTLDTKQFSILEGLINSLLRVKTHDSIQGDGI